MDQPARRLRDDRGAVVVEAAMVFPLLVVFLCATIDFGVGFKDRMTIQSALRNGSRGGAGAVSAPNADQLALSTFYVGAAGIKGLDVKKVIIYRANGSADGRPSITCVNTNPTGSGNGQDGTSACNVYNWDQARKATDDSPLTQFRGGTGTTSTCASPAWDRWWCAGGTNTATNERFADLSSTATVDSLGMYVSYLYTPYSGVFYNSGLLVEDYVVMRLEPKPG